MKESAERHKTETTVRRMQRTEGASKESMRSVGTRFSFTKGHIVKIPTRGFSPVTELATVRFASFAAFLRAYHENVLCGEHHKIGSPSGRGPCPGLLRRLMQGNRSTVDTAHGSLGAHVATDMLAR